jgi:phosphate/sulfate permease
MDSDERRLTRRYIIASIIATGIVLGIFIVWWIIVGTIGEQMNIIVHGGLLNQVGVWLF